MPTSSRHPHLASPAQTTSLPPASPSSPASSPAPSSPRHVSRQEPRQVIRSSAQSRRTSRFQTSSVNVHPRQAHGTALRETKSRKRSALRTHSAADSPSRRRVFGASAFSPGADEQQSQTRSDRRQFAHAEASTVDEAVAAPPGSPAAWALRRLRFDGDALTVSTLSSTASTTLTKPGSNASARRSAPNADRIAARNAGRLRRKRPGAGTLRRRARAARRRRAPPR
mmetsp:Transcript_31595/g.111229  ORF Transcript_31595/g.111229 Transcript_31595/m.111229 type:complete len:226 (-) Transcript_31595:787-1464(-)